MVLMVYLFGWKYTEHEYWFIYFVQKCFILFFSAYIYNLLNVSKNIHFDYSRMLPQN